MKKWEMKNGKFIKTETKKEEFSAEDLKRQQGDFAQRKVFLENQIKKLQDELNTLLAEETEIKNLLK